MAVSILRDLDIRNAKYSTKVNRVSDGNGLYLRINKSGSKSFDHRLLLNRKTVWISLGVYEKELTLKAARDLNTSVKAIFADGYSVEMVKSALAKTKTPTEVSKLVLGLKQTDAPLTEEMTFQQIHEAWHAYKSPSWKNPVHRHQAKRNIAHYCYPYFGNIPVSKITDMDIVNALEPIWVGKHESARRIKQWLGKIFEMAASPKYRLVTANPAKFSTEFLLPDVKQSDHHQPSVHYEKMPELWAAVCNKPNSVMLSIAATKLVLLTAKRAGEVINIRWQDINLERAEWAVYDPAMTKTGQPHRCPLPREAVDLLSALKPITGNRELVFYKPNTKSNRIALDVPRKTLQSAWGGRDVSAHGTRHSLKTWAMETGYRKELSEMQLSHEEQGIEAVYNDADYLRDRHIMMQHWADYLTGAASLDERNRV
jgi:integrase